MAPRRFIEIKFQALADPSPSIEVPHSKGGRDYVKTVGVELWTNTVDNLIRVAPITDLGHISNIAFVGLPFDKKSLLQLSAAFAELAESAPDLA